MRKYIPFLLLALVLVSCSPDDNRFTVEGRFQNLNQGEFYIYNIDGGQDDLDTVKIESGRFSFSKQIAAPATFVMVFPNFSEQPIFVQPGAKIKIKVDASRLKEMEVKGTDDNELMNEFRAQLVKGTPAQEKGIVERFIRNNSDSRVSVYLIERYLLHTPKPDFVLAMSLLKQIEKEGNVPRASFLQKSIEGNKNAQNESTLPRFSFKDTHNRTISNANLKSELNIIHTWASWNYTSVEILRFIQQKKRQNANRISVISIAVNADKSEIANTLQYDSITSPVICDGKLFEGKAVRTFGLYSVPEIIVANRQGKVIATARGNEQIREELNKLIK